MGNQQWATYDVEFGVGELIPRAKQGEKEAIKAEEGEEDADVHHKWKLKLENGLEAELANKLSGKEGDEMVKVALEALSLDKSKKMVAVLGLFNRGKTYLINQVRASIGTGSATC